MTRVLLTAGLLAALFAGAGCRRVPPPGGATGSRPDQARKEAHGLAVAAAAGAAGAHAKLQAARRGGGSLFGVAVATGTGMTVAQATAQQTPPPVPQPPAPQPPPVPQTAVATRVPPRPAFRPGAAVVFKETVASTVSHASEAAADEDAIAAAADVIARRLADLDPPVDYRPSPNEVRNEFLRQNSRNVRRPTDAERAELEKYDVDPNRVYVEYEVEVTVDQVRALRTRDRVADAIRVFGGLTAIFAAGYLFLLLDARTKGYLTRWLAVGAVALAAAAAAVLYFV